MNFFLLASNDVISCFIDHDRVVQLCMHECVHEILEDKNAIQSVYYIGQTL